MTQSHNSADYEFAICQIGAFHGATRKTPTNADALANSLRLIAIDTIGASGFTSPVLRVTDMVQTLLRYRMRYRVVLVHVYSGQAFLWAALTTTIARLLKKRLILWLHGGNLPSYYLQHKRLVDYIFTQADQILAPSGYLASAFQPAHDVEIIRYELPINTYPYRERSSLKPKLLWLRAFNSGYNPTMAIHVIRLLREQHPDVELLMCGPDTGDGSFQATQELTKQLNLDAQISFPGKISKERIREAGTEYDIFINTTNYDNTPVSIIEAMAMGMCVVSTSVGGLPYLIDHGQTGLLVPAGDAEGMAKVCHDLLTNSDLAQRISRQAHDSATVYDWDVLAPQWRKILTSLHAGGQPTRSPI